MRQKQHRVFFALWPDEQTQHIIHEAFRHTPQYKQSGRLLRPASYHVTLHFIGNIPEDRLPLLRQIGNNIRAPGFYLTLDHYGHFSRARVMWMGVQSQSADLSQLHQQLGHALSESGIPVEQAPFIPHISLMRSLSLPGEFSQFEAIRFQVKEITLVESIMDGDSPYRILDRFCLSE